MNNFYYTLYNSAYLITTLVIMLFKSTYNIKLIPLIFLLFTIEPISLIINAQISWSSKIDSVSTLSSPRAADLNDDGVKDLVVGAGTDSTFSNYGVVALDGISGNYYGIYLLQMKFSPVLFLMTLIMIAFQMFLLVGEMPSFMQSTDLMVTLFGNIFLKSGFKSF